MLVARYSDISKRTKYKYFQQIIVSQQFLLNSIIVEAEKGFPLISTTGILSVVTEAWNGIILFVIHNVFLKKLLYLNNFIIAQFNKPFQLLLIFILQMIAKLVKVHQSYCPTLCFHWSAKIDENWCTHRMLFNHPIQEERGKKLPSSHYPFDSLNSPMNIQFTKGCRKRGEQILRTQNNHACNLQQYPKRFRVNNIIIEEVRVLNILRLWFKCIQKRGMIVSLNLNKQSYPNNYQSNKENWSYIHNKPGTA